MHVSMNYISINKSLKMYSQICLDSSGSKAIIIMNPYLIFINFFAINPIRKSIYSIYYLFLFKNQSWLLNFF